MADFKGGQSEFTSLETETRGLLNLKKKHLIFIGGGIILVFFGLAFAQKSRSAQDPSFYLTRAKRGDMVLSVSGSGSVVSKYQIDLKPSVSEEVTQVYVKEGDLVKAGQLIASLKSTDARKAVSDAETSLVGANLSLKKLENPPDSAAVKQAQDAISQASDTQIKSEDDQTKAINEGFNRVSTIFIDLPGMMSSFTQILKGKNFPSSQAPDNITFYGQFSGDDSLKNDALDQYDTAFHNYNQTFSDFRDLSRTSDISKINDLINETHDTESSISDAMSKMDLLIGNAQNVLSATASSTESSMMTSQSNALKSYIAKINTDLSNLATVQTAIRDASSAATNASQTVSEKTDSLNQLKNNSSLEDVAYQEYVKDQAQKNLDFANEKLGDYFIKAPLSGVVARVYVHPGDLAAPTNAVVTILSGKSLANISLNEIDAVKVVSGQKAVLTFDAIPDLSLNGTVNSVDSFGTASQGVVSFGVKILPDTADERVKPGMTVSAEITLGTKKGVVYVPNGAIQFKGGKYYVQVAGDNGLRGQNFAEGTPVALRSAPVSKEVSIGENNGQFTEITSGLSEEEWVVLRQAK